MHSYLIVSVAICLLYIATDVSAAPSSTQNGKAACADYNNFASTVYVCKTHARIFNNFLCTCRM